MRVYLQALGCRLNEAENDAWARALRRQGSEVGSTRLAIQVPC